MVGDKGDGIPSFGYVNGQQSDGLHPCPMPQKLAELAISLFTYRGDVIVDPYVGSGTTAAAAQRLGRRWVGVDISESYCADAQERLRKQNAQLETGAEGDGADDAAEQPSVEGGSEDEEGGSAANVAA